jgi:hypothetical protein
MSDAQRVANLAAWFETMRGPDGYGGPVVHWWQNCLSFTGAGLDWRYEGLISGYLTLHERTGEPCWLARARRAGDDLRRGQLPSGHFRHSSFEQNPYSGGTPHEAAVDLGMLRLAAALRDRGEDGECYAAAAEASLRGYFLGRLWDEAAHSFRDSPDIPSLVPNKACTLAEALFALADWRGATEPIERYALPTLAVVVALQVKSPGRLAGAIPQNTIRNAVVEAYFPYYIARCVPALLLAHAHTGDERWAAAALDAGQFIMRHVDADGRLPQVLYRRGANHFPQWIAPLGDVLRALDRLRPLGFDGDSSALASALRADCLPSGGVATARGFAAQIGQRFDPAAPPDFRDNLPVAGWADKAFAWLAGQIPVGQPLPPPRTGEVALDCAVGGRAAQWRETAAAMTLTAGGRTLYEWRKGEPWAAVVAPEVMAR